MSAPVIPALSTNTVARKYVLEIDLNHNVLAPNYQPAGGLKTFTFVSDDAQMQDDRRFSDAGANRQNKTGTGWSASATLSRAPKASVSTAYDDAQEYLRAHGEGKIGPAAEVNVRFYEFDPDVTLPRVQAYAGTALVTYNEPNGGPLDNSDATVTLSGQGPLLNITHPYPAAGAAPVLTSATPGTVGTIATAGGVIVRIRGTHMAGTTAVTFGGTTATSITVVDDSLVICIAPAKTAGSQNLVVTNGTGASAPLPVVYA
jgi:hypothetical protein